MSGREGEPAPKLTPAQRKHLLRAYEAGGTTDGVTYGPLDTLRQLGLAREVEVNPWFGGRPMGMRLTARGMALAAKLGREAGSS